MSPDPGPFKLGDVGGSGPAVLCLHGLTGTPYEVRPPAEALAEAGFACLGPLLPGHGTHPDTQGLDVSRTPVVAHQYPHVGLPWAGVEAEPARTLEVSESELLLAHEPFELRIECNHRILRQEVVMGARTQPLGPCDSQRRGKKGYHSVRPAPRSIRAELQTLSNN